MVFDGAIYDSAVFDAGAGDQSLTAPLTTNSSSFYSAALSLALIASLLTNTQSFYDPQLDLNLVAPLHSASQTFYAATVAQRIPIADAGVFDSNVFDAEIGVGGGAQSVTVPLETNSQTFYSPVLSSLRLLPPLLTNSQSFYAPQVNLQVDPALHTNSPTFYGPTIVTTGSIAAPLFTGSQTFYAPTLTPGAVSATLPHHTNEPAIYLPQVNLNAVVPFLANSQTFYGITASHSQALNAPLLSNAQTFYGPQLNLGIVMGGIAAATVTVLFLRGVTRQSVAQPAAVAGDQDLFAGLFSGSQSFYASTVIVQGVLAASLHSNAQTFYAPIVLPSSGIAAPLFINSPTFYAPQVNLRLTVPKLTNSQTLYGPTVLGSSAFAAPFHTNSQTFYAPSVGLGLVAPLTSNTQSFYGSTVSFPGNSLVAPLFSNTQTDYAPQVNYQVAPPLFSNSQLFHSPIISVAGTPGLILSTPTVTKTSSAGAELEVDVVMGNDIRAGIYLRIQRSVDGVKNASDGTYANATLNVLHLVTGNEEEAAAVTNAGLAPDGYFSANGFHRQQYRWEREDGALSGWSAEVSDTVTDPVASFPVVNDVNKHYSCTINGYSWDCSNQGVQHGARTMQAKTGKGHAEFTVTSITATNGILCMGVVDATTVLGPTQAANPGLGSAGGCTFQLKPAGAWSFNRNGGTASGNLGVTAVAGDIVVMEFDTATNVVSFYFRDVSAGTTTLVTSATLTSRIPAAWHGYVGGFRGADAGVANFGKSAFTVTPTTGYSGW